MAGDTIVLQGIRMLCLCGALPEEQDRRQPYEFDLELTATLPATVTDRLDDTLDYGVVLDTLAAVVADERFQLFERMAARVAEEMLRFERVEEVTVTVRKLRPPVPHDIDSGGIRLTRRRG